MNKNTIKGIAVKAKEVQYYNDLLASMGKNWLPPFADSVKKKTVLKKK